MGTRVVRLHRQPDEALPGHLYQAGILLLQFASHRRGTQLRHNFAAVGHHDHLPIPDVPEVLAEMVFELTDPDLFHPINVAA